MSENVIENPREFLDFINQNHRTVRKIYKSAMRHEPKPKCMIPSRVSIRKWTALYHGDESRTDWISSLIIEEGNKDQFIADHTFIDPDGNVSLDEYSVIGSEELSAFFGEDQILGMFKFLKERNRLPNMFTDVYNCFMKLDDRKEKLKIVNQFEGICKQFSEVDKKSDVYHAYYDFTKYLKKLYKKGN